MATSTIRVRRHSHEALKQIAESTGQSLQDALDRAIEDLRRRVYLEGLNADYAALREDSSVWAAFQKEAAEWDATNEDGLEEG